MMTKNHWLVESIMVNNFWSNWKMMGWNNNWSMVIWNDDWSMMSWINDWSMLNNFNRRMKNWLRVDWIKTWMGWNNEWSMMSRCNSGISNHSQLLNFGKHRLLNLLISFKSFLNLVINHSNFIIFI